MNALFSETKQTRATKSDIFIYYYFTHINIISEFNHTPFRSFKLKNNELQAETCDYLLANDLVGKHVDNIYFLLSKLKFLSFPIFIS